MSKAFIADVIQNSTEITGVAANRAAADLIEAIVKELKKTGGFTLPSFGTFTVKKTERDGSPSAWRSRIAPESNVYPIWR